MNRNKLHVVTKFAVERSSYLPLSCLREALNIAMRAEIRTRIDLNRADCAHTAPFAANGRCRRKLEIVRAWRFSCCL